MDALNVLLLFCLALLLALSLAFLLAVLCHSPALHFLSSSAAPADEQRLQQQEEGKSTKLGKIISRFSSSAGGNSPAKDGKMVGQQFHEIPLGGGPPTVIVASASAQKAAERQLTAAAVGLPEILLTTASMKIHRL